MRQKMIEAGIGDMLLYIGGNVVVGKQPWPEVEKRFKQMGFDRVFPPGTMPDVTIDALKEDLRME
jgi:methylaspartate mutase sigma subunit